MAGSSGSAAITALASAGLGTAAGSIAVAWIRARAERRTLDADYTSALAEAAAKITARLTELNDTLSTRNHDLYVTLSALVHAVDTGDGVTDALDAARKYL
jgi:hypothetical protein